MPISRIPYVATLESRREQHKRQVFDLLDVDGSGFLDVSDLQARRELDADGNEEVVPLPRLLSFSLFVYIHVGVA